MVYARFTPTLTNVTTNRVTQWDYGRTLRIDGLELPTATRIDFGVSGGQTTVSRIGITKDGVTDVVIPDSLLEQSSNIVAYVYVNDTTEGKTVRTINIPVTARAKPEEYDSPESKELFAEVIELLNDAVDRAETAANTAESCADTATAAVNAVNSAGAAQVQAVNKKGSESVSDVEAKKQESIAAVKAEGETQLQAIAEETAQIVSDREQINSNTRNKAGAIVLDAEGESIVVNDASDFPLIGLKLFGKSTQDGTPTPDVPVDIVSVENPTVTVDEQTLALSYTIPGIPVKSGGNYTDANGQQWICDEVDLARGVYVQRIRTETFDGGNADYWWEYNSTGYEGYARTLSDMLSGLRWSGYCNRFPSHPAASTEPGLWFGADNNVLYLHSTKELFPTLDQFKAWLTANPMIVVYPLATPIETPLYEAEITAFRALHSNKPNTTILNDAGAHMAVEYVADTKTYIDRQIAALLSNET